MRLNEDAARGKSRQKPVRAWEDDEEYDEDEEDDEDDEDEYDDEYEDDDMDPKMERITTILAIVAAVIIGIIALVLVANAVGILGNDIALFHVIIIIRIRRYPKTCRFQLGNCFIPCFSCYIRYIYCISAAADN